MTPDDIKNARKTLGLTQEGLAQRIGVTTSTVSKWEQGVRPVSNIAKTFIDSILKEAKGIYIDELVNKNSICRKVSSGKTDECPIYDPDFDHWVESDNDFRKRVKEAISD